MRRPQRVREREQQMVSATKCTEQHPMSKSGVADLASSQCNSAQHCVVQ